MKKAFFILISIFSFLQPKAQGDSSAPKNKIVIDMDGIITGNFFSSKNDESQKYKYRFSSTYYIDAKGEYISKSGIVRAGSHLTTNASLNFEKLKKGSFVNYLEFDQLALNSYFKNKITKTLSISLNYNILTSLWKNYKYEDQDSIVLKRLYQYYRNPIIKDFGVSVVFVKKAFETKFGLAAGKVIKMTNDKLFTLNEKNEMYGLNKGKLKKTEFGYMMEFRITNLRFSKNYELNSSLRAFVKNKDVSWLNTQLISEIRLKQKLFKNLILFYSYDFRKVSYEEDPVQRVNFGIAYNFLLSTK